MSVHEDRGRWLVRWRDGSGRQRGKRFDTAEATQAFDGIQQMTTLAKRDREQTAFCLR